MLAPKCLLAPLPRAGQKKGKQMLAKLSNRFSRWQRGALSSLWTEAQRSIPKGTPPTRTSSTVADSLDPDVVRRVAAAVSEGAYSKGITMLADDSRLAPVNDDTLNKLHSLHPTGTPLQRARQLPWGHSKQLS